MMMVGFDQVVMIVLQDCMAEVESRAGDEEVAKRSTSPQRPRHTLLVFL